MAKGAMMIYTVGERTSYDKSLAEATSEKPFMKRGQGFVKGVGFYRGGVVFKTRDHAEALAALPDHAKENWGVYGVEADWDKHAIDIPGETFRRLIVDRQIVRLP